MKGLIFTLSAGLILAGLITLAALESGGVAKIATTNPANGEERLTHIWFLEANDDAGPLHLEAGHPSNPWVEDLRVHPYATIDGKPYQFFLPSAGQQADTHEHIRLEMRRKYGWRDVWVGLLFDTSQSFMIGAYPQR